MLARAHLLNNQPALAQENLEKAVEADPKDLAARADLVKLLAEIGETDRVLEQLNEILDIDPKNRGALESLFKLNIATRDWKSAQLTAQRIKQSYPNKPEGFYLSGLAYQAEGNYEESIVAFEKALALKPDAVEPLTQMVRSYLAMDKADAAHARLVEAMKQNPQSFVAQNLTGEVLILQKKHDAAANAFRKTIKLKPDWEMPYRSLASTRLLMKDKKGAVDAYLQGLKVIPDSPVLVTGLAVLYEQENQPEKAIALYEEVMKRNPDSTLAANNLAMLLVDNKTDEASLSRAMELANTLKKSRNPAFLDTVGWVEYSRGDYQAAIINLEQAVKNAPNAMVLRYHLGMAYYAIGDNGSARRELEKALESGSAFRGKNKAEAALEKLNPKP